MSTLFDFSCPEKPAIESASFSCTYKELHLLLCSFDVKDLKEKKVALIGESDPFIIITYFALIHQGIEVAILNPKQPLGIIKKQLKQLSIKTLYVTKHLPLENIEQKVCSKCFTCHSKLQTPSFSQICTYLFTSGSTKKPKIAALSYQNHYYSAKGLLKTLKLTSESKYLLCLPLFHVSGLSILYRAFLSKATVVLAEEDLFSLMKKAKISHVSLVSTQLSSLLKEECLFTDLKAVLVGGSAIPSLLLKEAIEKKLPIFASYGMTEMASTITCSKLKNQKQIGFSGHLLAFRKLKIANDGEIFIGGKTLFAGYYNPKTQKIEKPPSFFSTKDLGSYKKGKGLLVEKRKDLMFISGGENIYPEEIEQVLLQKKEISKAVVVPVTDEKFGNVGIAFIQSKESIDPALLKEFLSHKLPKYKIPKQFLPFPSKVQSSFLKITKKIRDALLKHVEDHA